MRGEAGALCPLTQPLPQGERGFVSSLKEKNSGAVMSNTLYLPELREMLAENDEAGLKEFCTALHPARTAEFMEGLTAEEAWAVLQHAELSLRVEIFGFFEEQKQIEILERLDRKSVV